MCIHTYMQIPVLPCFAGPAIPMTWDPTKPALCTPKAPTFAPAVAACVPFVALACMLAAERDADVPCMGMPFADACEEAAWLVSALKTCVCK